MVIGIFKIIKNAFKSISCKVKDFSKKVINSLPQVANIGHQILNKDKPMTQFIPDVGPVVDSLDKGFNIAHNIGKSLMDEF